MTVRLGAVGLGRLGRHHATNLAQKIPGTRLVALCDIEAERLDLAARELGVQQTFTAYDQLLKWGQMDGVVLSSPSGQHGRQIEQALARGLHVFCEKPLATSLEECRRVQEAAKRHPDRMVMLGFMRRFDPSYQDAKQRIDRGEIGRPILLRAYSQDPESAIQGAIAYAGHSGGQFIDMAVHDIDLARWLVGAQPVAIFATGSCYAHPEFARYGDGDNVSALIQCKDGTMVFLFAGRTAPHGYNVETEIIGTKGTLRIAAIPQRNHLEILDGYGVRRECSSSFLERFAQAYLDELVEFVACIRQGRKPEVGVHDATRVTEIAYKCKEAFESGQLVQL